MSAILANSDSYPHILNTMYSSHTSRIMVTRDGRLILGLKVRAQAVVCLPRRLARIPPGLVGTSV